MSTVYSELNSLNVRLRLHVPSMSPFFRTFFMFYITLKKIKGDVDLACKRVIITIRNEVCEGNVFTPVCHSVHWGVSASVHAGIDPHEQTPPS